MAKKVIVSQQKLTTARVDFAKDDFDVLIAQKGVIFLHEVSVKCSCIREVNGSALPSCPSCLGSGYVFIDPFEISGIVQAINFDPKVMQYSEVNLGTAQLTTRYSERIGWFDRVTLCDGETIFMENTFPQVREVNGVEELSSLLTYAVLSVVKAYMFIDNATPQVELVEDTDFTVDGRKFILSDAIKTELQSKGESKKFIGIRYLHRPTYLIMDIQKDIRNTRVIGVGGVESIKNLPINCIIKKAHYALNDTGFGANSEVS